ncbi:hypothetical protein TraAM80_01661 [Trypanosoma rangeli]|uniref:Uncharacterized protein n=1 Tax=Trypanosoma rangeli TaxID=5698 RepID=A0A3R7KUV6_TRYRA|nr:uncharacterized protein TraAM80_01661 [Trypanosoma rangeli]RNF10222.1 hypothetical protein TraAM80_01661 [Trypanosoma rangeli]|eukprot:RNF10222.1 hypothetical protein TraAM80_01661 [Trypanosoma rangeli]
MTPTRDAGVQTPAPSAAAEGLWVVGTSLFGAQPSASQQPVVVGPTDMNRVLFGEVAGEEEEEEKRWPMGSGGGNHGSRGKTAPVPAAAAEAPPARRFNFEEQREKTEKTAVPGTAPTDPDLGDTERMPPGTQAPSVANYAKTLNLMRERVKCIQALIHESGGQDACRGDDRSATSEGNSKHSHSHGGHEVKDNHGGRSRLHSSGEIQRSPRCGSGVQPQQQQGLCSSPRLFCSTAAEAARRGSRLLCLRAPRTDPSRQNAQDCWGRRPYAQRHLKGREDARG